MEFDRVLVWMEPWIDRDFAPPPYDPGVATVALEAAGRSEQVHARLLQRWNGFYALGGLLHVLGACEAPPNHSLRAWNASDGWRSAWGRFTEDAVYFAHDAFGDQFGYRAGKVVRFRASTGNTEPLRATLDEWLELAFLEPDYLFSRRTFEACVKRHGPLPHGGLFVPVGPAAIAGEDLDPSKMQIAPARDALELRAIAARSFARRSSQSMLRMPKG